MKTLLFVALGEGEVFSGWAKFIDRPEIDIAVVNYDSSFSESSLPFKCKFFWQEAGRKHSLFKKALIAGRCSLEDYDYYWLLDDDLLISPADVDVFLGFLESYQPAIAQPSIRGFASHYITKCQSIFLARWTSFIEIQAACFSRSALTQVLPYFDQTITGGGMDLIFWSLLGKPRRGLMVVDCTSALHLRPTQTGISEDAVQSRRYFEEHYGRDPHENLAAITFRHLHLNRFFMMLALMLCGQSFHPRRQKTLRIKLN